MSKSLIEWTEATWNPWIGCTPVSPGCDICWAKREEDGRFRHRGRCVSDADIAAAEGQSAGEGWKLLDAAKRRVPYFAAGPVWQGDRVLEKPLHWRKPRTIFVCSRSDLFHEDIPFEEIDRVFAVMAACPQHRFLVLTKRARRSADWGRERREVGHRVFSLAGKLGRAQRPVRLPYAPGHELTWPLPNVGLGVTVCNQKEADAKIPDLLACPAAMWFVSLGPLLGSVQLDHIRFPHGSFENVLNSAVSDIARRNGIDRLNGVDWVTIGAESGPRKSVAFDKPQPGDMRICSQERVRGVVGQCRAAGVPCFVKQLHVPVYQDAVMTGFRLSHDPAEWPEDLRVRELPAMLKKVVK